MAQVYRSTIYASMVWLLATIFVAYSFSLNTAAAVFSSAIQISLHASNLGVALASGAFILGFACMQIPAGHLLDRYNARLVVSGGVLLLASGNLLISFSTHIFAYAVANLIQGMGASFAFIAAAVLISQWFPEKRFPILFGLTQTLSCIFSAIIHYYFTVILSTHTWNSLYQSLAVFGFILLTLVFLIIKSPARFKNAAQLSLRQSLALVFHQKQILLCVLAAASSFGALLAYAGFWFMHIQAFYSIDTLQATMMSGLIFIGIGIGTPFWGWLSNLLRSRILVIHVTLCLGLIALLLGIYLPHYHNLIITKVISFLTGFFLSGSMLFYTMVNEYSALTTRGVAISLLNTSVFLFNTLLLFIPYLFYTALSKGFFTSLWVLPVCVIFSILVLHFIKDSL